MDFLMMVHMGKYLVHIWYVDGTWIRPQMEKQGSHENHSKVTQVNRDPSPEEEIPQRRIVPEPSERR